MPENFESPTSRDTKEQNKELLTKNTRVELSNLMSEIDLNSINKYNSRLEDFHTKAFDGLSGLSPDVARATQQRAQGAARMAA
ncbi:hypothetical protein KA013_02455 [Patescibacteria group bacterium]|nr:hypothetical protein [Patescibacteria group bacterium]